MENISIQKLKNKYKGQTAYIVGKGPSIEYLREDYFDEDGPVIVFYEALNKVEEFTLKAKNPIYSMQKDGGPWAYLPQKEIAGLIVHKHESSNMLPEVKRNRYEFDNCLDFKLPVQAFSAISGIEICLLMGCDKIVFIGFDSYTHGDNRTWLPNEIADTNIHGAQYPAQAWMMNEYIANRNINSRWVMPSPKKEDKLVKLIVATPFYEMKGFSPYIRSLLQMSHLFYDLGVDFNPETDFWSHDGDSYVDRARNSLIAKFMYMRPDATDILFIDSDHAWAFDHRQAIINIIASPYEVTGGAYPIKNNWEQYGVAIDTDADGIPNVCPTTGMIEGTRISGGFMRIKRSTIDKLVDAYPESQYLDNSTANLLLCHEIFHCSVIKRRRWGEDYNFCRKWNEIGGKVWIEPRINFGHFGINGWYGNYHEFLTRQPGGCNYQEPLQEINI